MLYLAGLPLRRFRLCHAQAGRPFEFAHALTWLCHGKMHSRGRLCHPLFRRGLNASQYMHPRCCVKKRSGNAAQRAMRCLDEAGTLLEGPEKSRVRAAAQFPALLRVRQRLVVSLQPVKDYGAVEAGAGEVRIQRKGPVAALQRRLVAPQRRERGSTVVVGVRQARVQLDRLVAILQRFLVPVDRPSAAARLLYAPARCGLQIMAWSSR